MVGSFSDMINLRFLRDILVKVSNRQLFIDTFIVPISHPCLNKENSNNPKEGRKSEKRKHISHDIENIKPSSGLFDDQLETWKTSWRASL